MLAKGFYLLGFPRIVVHFGLSQTAIEVEEDEGMRLVCVEQRSDQPTLDYVYVDIQSTDQTAGTDTSG